MPDIYIKQRESPMRCAICHDSDEYLSECHRCHVRIHLECFAGNGDRCPTMGCVERITLGEALGIHDPETIQTSEDSEWRSIGIKAQDYSLYGFIILSLISVIVVMTMFAAALVLTQ